MRSVAVVCMCVWHMPSRMLVQIFFVGSGVFVLVS